MDSFGIRLRKAFNGAKNAEIARKLGVTQTAIKNYMEGRIPSSEILIEIKNLTNVKLDWLLTGDPEESEAAPKPQLFELNEAMLLDTIRELIREELDSQPVEIANADDEDIQEIRSLQFGYEGMEDSGGRTAEDDAELTKIMKRAIARADKLQKVLDDNERRKKKG